MPPLPSLPRRLHLRAALFAGTVAIASFGATASRAASESTPSLAQTEEQQVIAVDDEYVAAEIKRDETALRRLIDDRFVLNSGKGTTSGKEEMVERVLKAGILGQKISERSVLIEGDFAFVFATAELRFAAPGKPESVSTLRYTCTYVKRQGQWRMLVLQMQPRAAN